MLDRAVALARRECDVGRGDVVLEIDEVLVEPAAGMARGHGPEQPDRGLLHDVDLRQRGAPPFPEPTGRGGRLPRLASLGQGECECPGPVAAAGRELRLACFAGNEGAPGLVEREPAAGLGEEMDRRIPAAGHAYEIASNLPVPAGVRGCGGVQRRDRDAGHRLRAPHVGDRVSRQQLDAPAPQLRAPGVRQPGPDVGQHYAQAGVGEVEGGVVGGVVVGEHHRAGAGAHRVPVDVAPGRRCQHHPRAVVVPEHQGALMRSGGEHHLLRAHLPQALADPAAALAIRKMVGTALQYGEVVVIVVPEGGGPRQDPHLFHRREIRTPWPRPTPRPAHRRSIDWCPADDRRARAVHRPGAPARRSGPRHEPRPAPLGRLRPPGRRSGPRTCRRYPDPVRWGHARARPPAG